MNAMFLKSSFVPILFVGMLFLQFDVRSQFTVGSPNNFISVWNSMESGSITLPGTETGYNYTLYWEDVLDPTKHDTIFLIVSNNYTVVGLEPFRDFRIEISGKFPRLYTNSSSAGLKLREIRQWGTISWKNMQAALKGTANLKITAQDTPDLSEVTDMSEMFYGSVNFNGSLANWNWNVSTITTLKSTFEASDFNENIRTWNVENVTDMKHTFAHNIKFNVPLSTWNVGNVINMFETFLSASAFNQNIGTWNVGNVENMTAMFKNASSFNQNLGAWNLNHVVDLNFMFESSGMDCVHYSQTLIGWAASPTTPYNLWLINLSGISYSSEAMNARNTLISTKGWTFLDDVLINDPLPNIGTISGPDTLCVNTVSSFVASENSGVWNSSISTVLGIDNGGSVVASAVGTSVVSYTVTSANGCSGQATHDVVVLGLPTAGTISGANTISKNEQTVFVASQFGGFWSSSNTEIATIDYLSGKTIGIESGITQIIYTVTNFCGSTTTDVLLQVTNVPEELPSGLSEWSQVLSEISIYPNPTTQTATVRYELSHTVQNFEMQLIDAVGQMVFYFPKITLMNGAYSLELPLHEYDSGMYTLLLSINGHSLTKKIMKL